jgi:hypothetical protein
MTDVGAGVGAPSLDPCARSKAPALRLERCRPSEKAAPKSESRTPSDESVSKEDATPFYAGDRGHGQDVTQQRIEAHLIEGCISPGDEIGLKIDQSLPRDATGTTVMPESEAIGVSTVRTKLLRPSTR